MKIGKYIDSATKLLNPFEREIEPSIDDRGLASVEVKSFDAVKRQVTGVLSTDTVDRYGEVVLPSAFSKSLPMFMKNPKFLAGHASSSPDGSPTSIGSWTDMKVTSEGLIGTAQFLPPGDALTDKWWFRVVNNAVRTFSVGFLTKQWEMRKVKVGDEPRTIRHFTEAELVEVSLVEIPANPDAMMRCASAFGAASKSVAVAWGDADELAQFYNNLIGKLEQATEAGLKRIESLINKVLTDPTGPIDAHIREVAAAFRDHGSHGHGHDLDDPDMEPAGSAKNKGMDEFKAALRDALK